MRLAKQHICITHRHRQQRDNSQREGRKGWGGVRQRGRKEDICSSVNNKIKVKKTRRDIKY